MYNEGQKNEFMDANGMDQWKFRWASSVFNNVEHMEVKLGKDIAMMTADEVGKALATSDVTSSITLSNRIPFIVRYKAWCAEQGYPALLVESGDIHVDVSDNIRDTMVCSEKDLAKILERGFPELSANDSKCIYKAHLWLGYAGMQDLDSVRVKVSDVDFNQCSIFFENKMYYFPQEGKRDIQHACEMKVFDRVMNGKPRSFRRAENDRILRGRITKFKVIDDKEYLVKTLRCSVRLGLTAAGHAGMSYIRIRRSGIFREAFKQEISGIQVDFSQVGNDDFMFEGKHATQGQTKRKILRRIILQYEKDYEAWKNAFEKELLEEFKLDKLPHQFKW